MYQTKAVEKPYSKAEIKRIKKLFVELKKAGKSKSVQEYVKKVEAELKA